MRQLTSLVQVDYAAHGKGANMSRRRLSPEEKNWL